MNRKYSLKKGSEIEAVIHNKKTVGDRYYVIYYLFYNEEAPQIAISASKKLKTAVAKNYEKKIIREIIRPHVNLLIGTKVLIVAKAAIKEIEITEKRNRLLKLIEKINKEKQ